MKKGRFLPIIISISMLFSASTLSFANGSSNTFSDISDDYWAHEAIQWMTENNIISGYPDNTFKPDNAVSRAEFAKMMVLALKLSIERPEASSFNDIDKNDWAFPYVETAKKYLTGFRAYNGDYYKPSKNAVREDMAVALVKAKKYENEVVVNTVLDNFSDKESISPNLRKYVAIALKHEIINGFPVSGSDKKVFKPDGVLTRAQAATLLFNVIGESKITFDENKVTYDENNTKNNTEPDKSVSISSKAPKVNASVKNGKILLNWSKTNGEGFAYYKIVISKNNPHPKYPEDGYLYYITDQNITTGEIDPDKEYVGGDFGGKLVRGQKYYFSITAVFSEGKYPGNALPLTVPGSGSVTSGSSYTVPNVSAAIVDGGMQIRWQVINDKRLSGYKVVISKSNSSPKYPNDGYFQWITDRNINSCIVHAGDGYNGGDLDGHIEAGQNYYISVTALYNDMSVKIPGNTVRRAIP